MAELHIDNRPLNPDFELPTSGARILDCMKTEEMQTSRVTSYLSTNLLVSLATCLITLSQGVLSEPW
jgi:hypothetical protein